ncbi:hypothetical protein BDR26DRAFT_870413 [Obelidium mucronatum]|nr:hypothetical protein BDR26DRAFT_870413 [Obelidium mucronatum]
MDSDSSSMLFDLDQSDADLWLEMSPDAFERDMTTFEYLCTEASFMAASSSSISHGLNSAILSPLVQNVPLAPLASPSPASCVLNPLLLSPLPSATTANHQQQHMMLSSNTYSRNGFLAPPSWTSPPPGPSSTRLYPASVIPQPQPHENLSADYRISSPILIHTSLPTATHQQQQQQNPLLSRTSNNIITDSRSRQHQCGTCGKLCLRKQDLKRHEATHATSKDFWCPHGCGSAFARNDALGRHVKTGRCLQKVAKRMGSVGSSGGGVSAERNDSS